MAVVNLGANLEVGGVAASVGVAAGCLGGGRCCCFLLKEGFLKEGEDGFSSLLAYLENMSFAI